MNIEIEKNYINNDKQIRKKKMAHKIKTKEYIDIDNDFHIKKKIENRKRKIYRDEQF